MEQALFLLIGVGIAAAVAFFLHARQSGELTRTRSEQTDLNARFDEVKTRENSLQTQLEVERQKSEQAQKEAAVAVEIRSLLQERQTELRDLQEKVTILEKERTEAVERAIAASRRAEDQIETEKRTLKDVLKAKDDQLASQKEFIEKAREILTNEFKALSGDALKEVSEQLLKTADGLISKHSEKTTQEVALREEKIKGMLKPVEETMKRLDKQVEENNLKRAEAEGRLDEQVKRLAGASENLTNALKKPVIRGSFGEMTLKNALEEAGLEAEIDYILQDSTDAEDGRKRTDAIVNLPQGRKLIIDSKNMMETYLAYSNAPEEQRGVFAEAHARALRGHIRSLSAKEYWRRYDGIDCVILFIPHDGMYHSAIQDEPEIIREACEKRVFISNTMSLIPLLKAVRYVLDQERLNKSAEEISKVGSELYAEIARFAANFADVGKRLTATVKAYNDAIPGLDRYIVPKARTLKQLGAGKGKEAELPDSVDLEPRMFTSKELAPLNAVIQLEEGGLFEEKRTEVFVTETLDGEPTVL